MIAAILSLRPVRWLVGAVVAVLAFFGIVLAARRDAAQDAKKEAQHEYEQETARRVEVGRKALRDGPDGSPEQRVQSSDAKWRE